jgi:hypothetical protein
MKAFLVSSRGFAWMCIVTTVVVSLTFVQGWLAYDVSSRGYGIDPDLASFVVSSYAPVIGTTFIGFRNVVFANVEAAQPGEVARSRMVDLYVFLLIGFVVAEAAVIRLGVGLEVAKAKILIGFAATIWAATIGAVFSVFFKKYADQIDAVIRAAAAPPPPPAPPR